MHYRYIPSSSSLRAAQFRYSEGWSIVQKIWWLSVVFGCLTAIGCMSNYPHSLSYFNCLIGGSKNGHLYFAGSDVDWGQDMFLLKRWLERHPDVEIRGFDLFYPAQIVAPNATPIPDQPPPGTYIVSGCRLVDPENGPTVFLQYRPIDRIGYSMFVYQIPEIVTMPDHDTQTMEKKH